MINKIKKVFFGSLSRSLLIINILALLVTVVSTMIFIENDKGEYPEGLINKANEAYVESSRFVTRKSDSCEEYLDKVAKLNNFNMAIADNDGQILLKSSNVSKTGNKNYIPFSYIDLSHPFKDEKSVFYRVYEVKIDNEKCYLYVWKNTTIKSSGYYIWQLIAPIILMIAIIYLLINRKARYIGKIAKGVEILSSGDLDYTINEKGRDELNVLAKEINNMSKNLKQMREKEQEEEKQKYELITNISHDLRTPLTSLIGYLELINKKSALDEDINKYSNVSLDNANRLKSLIDDLFEYSKLESKDIKLNKSEINVVEIIGQCLGELELESKNANIDFVSDFSEEEVILNIDGDKIARVFQNIFTNAIKYSKKGTEVNIEIKESPSEVEFIVRNEYRELEKDKVNKIFERFYRGDTSRNLKVEGSGLGLPIVKSIVNLHGGKVFVKCDEEKETLEVHIVLLKS
ncbi:HAMP domain-containing sensor histidine kinase [Clostridium sp. 'White wine YQ']|uniref:HAMP domain-containing sensor histidine kinase n=1 Tax=Clostridium sp. 'White wine YQ' TaxID=3027474 RepID=UPI002365567B|nr:HAMP domain-containing sensor histidine kinase [Clostridium sp. 'White wine YQ']MDD7793521.1 HAMP domain-containing sensor histidine kinase [Clostridium sp. 'White wine YQ']